MEMTGESCSWVQEGANSDEGAGREAGSWWLAAGDAKMDCSLHSKWLQQVWCREKRGEEEERREPLLVHGHLKMTARNATELQAAAHTTFGTYCTEKRWTSPILWKLWGAAGV